MSKVYGFKLTDIVGGVYQRWFNADGTLTVPCTPDLMDVSKGIHAMDFNDALNYCTTSLSGVDIDVRILFEADFKAIEHPVKKLFKRMFK